MYLETPTVVANILALLLTSLTIQMVSSNKNRNKKITIKTIKSQMIRELCQQFCELGVCHYFLLLTGKEKDSEQESAQLDHLRSQNLKC